MDFSLSSVRSLSSPSGMHPDPTDRGTAREREKLKESCLQFESLLIAELWKKMASSARKIGGKKDEDRPFGPLEDLSVEMASEYLTKNGGMGLGTVLYDRLALLLPEKKEEAE
ncbi:hypothetical protein MASR2M17_05390 [Aminivibrio sp.]